jgi:hypothetical protein
VLRDEIAEADEVGDDLDLAAAPGAGADSTLTRFRWVIWSSGWTIPAS